MTKTTTNLLLMLITILAGTYFYITCCSTCGTSIKEEPAKAPLKEVVAAPVTPVVTSYPFAFSDGNYTYNESDNFNFNLSSSSVLTPISQKVTDGITSLKTHLAGNAGKVINLTGYYMSDETNNSAFPNLGIARANSVKNLLVENGISSAQINTLGELKNDFKEEDNVLSGPVSYHIGIKAANSDDEMKALYDQITADPLVFYFKTNQASINLNAEQRKKMANISRYLDKVVGSSCNVIGHTDNVGRRDLNIGLGKERADFAKSYLVKNGIAEAKIKTSSRGPDSPVETNATEAGRSKNRRTIVSLNKK